jgi:hypothetical protein
MAKVELTAIGKVKHSGHWYGPGDVIKDVNEHDAERLIKIGAAVTKAMFTREVEVEVLEKKLRKEEEKTALLEGKLAAKNNGYEN